MIYICVRRSPGPETLGVLTTTRPELRALRALLYPLRVAIVGHPDALVPDVLVVQHDGRS